MLMIHNVSTYLHYKQLIIKLQVRLNLNSGLLKVPLLSIVLIIDVADDVKILCSNSRALFSNVQEREIIGNHRVSILIRL